MTQKMDNAEIKKLLKRKESHTLEFKLSLSEPDRIVETACSFANTKGGIVLVGVSDKGIVRGIDIGRQTVEGLTNKIIDNTDTSIYPEITVENMDGKDIILVEVSQSPNKPHTAFDRPFIRVGKNTKRMKQSEYEQLLLKRKNISFDRQVCESASLKDLDMVFVESFIAKYELLNKTKVIGTPSGLLESLGCIKNKRPTNAGILLFGRNIQKFFPNVFIAIARYKGKEVGAERLDYKEFKGNLFDQVNNADRYIKENIAVMSRLLPYKVQRQDIPEYPLFSLRELITNAVAHRDYSEPGSKVIIKMFDGKINFYNPGGLEKGITPKNIASKQYSRNPLLTKVLSKVKYIEELGEGWDKILAEHDEHPLKPEKPEIDADEYSFSVTVFSTKEKFEEEKAVELNKRQKKALEYVKEKGSISRKEYVELCSVSMRTALRDMRSLLNLGLIEEKGRGRSLCYTRK
ncbi:putative DNA binding domain-containing protein [Candidatus Woesearchaeota archaeon]|nr:putative DNA binding domain-containing protein [Candidatus Woesearchaeota archaeon]